jgi:pyruvate dehydrogenase E1 component
VPVVAASDYVRGWPQLIAPHLEARLTVLGTDGFGRSDTRAQLREFFEVGRHHIVVAALAARARAGAGDAQAVARAIARYGLPVDGAPPWER